MSNLPNKTAWQYRVEGHLKDGLGVEDIAYWMNYDVAEVRAYVDELRASGKLAEMFGVAA